MCSKKEREKLKDRIRKVCLILNFISSELDIDMCLFIENNKMFMILPLSIVSLTTKENLIPLDAVLVQIYDLYANEGQFVYPFTLTATIINHIKELPKLDSSSLSTWIENQQQLTFPLHLLPNASVTGYLLLQFDTMAINYIRQHTTFDLLINISPYNRNPKTLNMRIKISSKGLDYLEGILGDTVDDDFNKTYFKWGDKDKVLPWSTKTKKPKRKETI